MATSSLSSPATTTTLTPAPAGPHTHGSDLLRERVHVAHGVAASAAVVLLFPAVAIVLRLTASPHIVTLHWILQLGNLGVLLVAFALGVWLSYLDGFVRLPLPPFHLWLLSPPRRGLADAGPQLWRWPHQVLGTVLVALFLLQPLLGLLQHRQHRRLRRASPSLDSPPAGPSPRWTPLARAHVWYGRLLIAAGILNGGLGLLLADNARPPLRAAYAVVAGLVAAAYVAAQVWWHKRVRARVVARALEREEAREKGDAV
jgi:hypothetical protein